MFLNRNRMTKAKNRKPYEKMKLVLQDGTCLLRGTRSTMYDGFVIFISYRNFIRNFLSTIMVQNLVSTLWSLTKPRLVTFSHHQYGMDNTQSHDSIYHTDNIGYFLYKNPFPCGLVFHIIAPRNLPSITIISWISYVWPLIGVVVGLILFRLLQISKTSFETFLFCSTLMVLFV